MFVTPGGFDAVSPFQVGNDPTVDSDADPNNGLMSDVVTLAAGEFNPTIDAGFYKFAGIGDFVWNDRNGNGIQDPDEPGIDGAIVKLLDANGNVLDSTTTGDDRNTPGIQNGYYEFTGLTPGDYKVMFVQPAGFTNVSPFQAGNNPAIDSDANPGNGLMSDVVTLVSGEFNPTIDAGFFTPAAASLGDFVWNDLNANGIQDPDEPGIDGATVKLLDANGNLLATTTTGDDPNTPGIQNGYYAFTGLTPGDYKVMFVTPGGFDAVSPFQVGNNPAIDSDADPANGLMSDVVTLAAGENNPTIDAGFYKFAGIGDFVWNDLNANGIQDPNEPGIDGATVKLLDASGNLLATTTTGDDPTTPGIQNGYYAFTGLTPGDYKVMFVQPAGFTNVSPFQAGNNPAIDSDANPANGLMSDVVTLVSGEFNPTIDAGFFTPAIPEIALEKYVRVDENPINLIKLVAVDPLDSMGTVGFDVCMTEGKPEELLLRYIPSVTFDTQQVPSKGQALIPGTLLPNGSIDDDGVSYIVVTDDDDPTNGISGDIFFAGDVAEGDTFSASIANAGSSFSSNTYFYFFDQQGGPLLQSAKYHTSCSAPIVLGDGILSATLVGYDGEDGNLITIPLPSFEDANEAPGPSTMVGTTVNFRYEVTNTGTTAISNVVLTDDRLETVTYVEGDTNNDGKLDPTEKWIYTATEVASEGLNTNLGTVTGKGENGNTVIALDPANYTGVDGPPVGSECPTGPIGDGNVGGPAGGLILGDLTKYLFYFGNGSSDANWQGATKGFAGDVVVNGILANERTSGDVPFAGTIYTNDSSLGSWQKIVDQNSGQASASTGQTALVSGLQADLLAAFTQVNALTATSKSTFGGTTYNFNNINAGQLNGLNTQDGINQTFVINVTSGFNVSTQINITGDAGDVYVLRWDTDRNSSNGYQGQVKFQSGGGIVPLGGLSSGNFIHVAGDLNASGGGSTPSALPQGPRLNDGTGTLIDGGKDFSGGGFFTGYWLTTGAPKTFDPSTGLYIGNTASFSNAIFNGGWYTLSDKFSMTSGTSGVHVCLNPATLPPAPMPPVDPPPAHGSSMDLVIQPQVDASFNPNNIGIEADTPTGPIAQLDDIITFTYEVTNPGSVNLEITSLVDDNATPGDTSDDFNPTYVEGDSNNDGLLNPGETWYYQAKILAEKGGQQTNIAKVVAETSDGTMVMTDDPGNYLINPLQLQKLVAVEPTDPGMVGQDVCMTEGKPEALLLKYIPSITFDTQQDPSKGQALISGSLLPNGSIDDDGVSYIVVTDDSDPTNGISGDIYFAGNVAEGANFSASIANAGSSFASNTYFYFFDQQGGPLLQSAKYHTSCSAPIVLGDGILSATLVGYDGENGGLITLPDPVFEDANTAPGPEAIVGSTVQFKYIVSNTGNEKLSNVNLSDDKIAGLTLEEDGNGDAFLDPGEEWIYSGSEIAKEGLQTNKGTATAKLGSTDLMAMDPANYTGIMDPPPSGDICDLFGKPVALKFDYITGTTVSTAQASDKAEILFDSGTVDDDGVSWIVVTDEDDATKALAGGGKRFFQGDVAFDETFVANNATDSFGSNTYIHFFDDSTGGLLQSISYHTSCSQPIQIGDVIGNATLIGYQGENGGFGV